MGLLFCTAKAQRAQRVVVRFDKKTAVFYAKTPVFFFVSFASLR